MPATDRQGKMSMKGRKMVVEVPYEQLGLKRGQQVRICFVDHMMEFFTDGRVSSDALLELH
jgi:hypothetical protein